jgi:hypothetical protein
MRLRIFPEAKEDTIEASVWYGLQRPGLDEVFERAVNLTLNRILSYPESAPCVFREHRSAVVREFPYKIIYDIDREEIVVRAVWQAEQDPAKLRDRLAPGEDE